MNGTCLLKDDHDNSRLWGRLKVFIGNSNPVLGADICRHLGIVPGHCNLGKFANGETKVVINESVRGCHVYIVQSCCSSINDAFLELLIMINCCKIASAARITVVIPFFFYSRQEKKDRSRAPITAKLISNMLTVAGADHIITMDLHASQIQGFFDIPVDNLYAEPCFIKWIKNSFPDTSKLVIVSPDAGGVKRVVSIADKLKVEFALIHKKRIVDNYVANMTLVGEVNDKIAILIDDMGDTCGTMILAAEELKKAKAKKIIVMITHPIFSNNALEKIENSAIDRIIVTTTIPVSDIPQSSTKLEILDISRVLASSISRTHHSQSISYLFDHEV